MVAGAGFEPATSRLSSEVTPTVAAPPPLFLSPTWGDTKRNTQMNVEDEVGFEPTIGFRRLIKSQVP